MTENTTDLMNHKTLLLSYYKTLKLKEILSKPLKIVTVNQNSPQLENVSIIMNKKDEKLSMSLLFFSHTFPKMKVKITALAVLFNIQHHHFQD